MNSHQVGNDGVVSSETETRSSPAELKVVSHSVAERHLACIYAIGEKMAQVGTLDDLSNLVSGEIVHAMQFPELAKPVISLAGDTGGPLGIDREMSPHLDAPILSNGSVVGALNVYYSDDQPFLLPDEQRLVDTLAWMIGGWIESHTSGRRPSDGCRNYRAIVQSLPPQVFVKDHDLIYQVVNDHFALDLGLPADEVIGKSDFDLYPEELAEQYREYDRQVLTTGETLEYEESHTKDGFEEWVQTIKTPLLDEKGRLLGVLGMYRDITDRKFAEKASLASERKYSMLFNSIRDAIVFSNPDREIIDSNPAFSEIFGYSPEEIRGKRIEHLYDSQAEFEEQSRMIMENLQDQHFHHTSIYRRESGEAFPGETNLFQLRDENGDPIAFAGLVRDVSEQRRAQAQVEKLLEADRSQAAGVAMQVTLASRIQQRLMQSPAIEMPNVDIATSWVPANEMSGDFYGLEQLDIHRLALWVGDVSAKGVPAGLLMVLLNASLRAELYGNFVPGNVLSQLSLNISNVLSEAEQFSTLFLGILDTSNGLLTYSDAGHGHALIFRAATRKIEKLSVTVLPLGIESQLMAVQKEVELNRSDILLVYSDGVTEAASPSGELFGEQRLYEIIRESGAGTVPALRDAIQAAVAQFSQGHILEDDLTLLIIQQEDTRGSGAPKDKPYNAQDPLREWRQLLTSHTGILVPLHEWVAGICSEINLHENPDEFVNACQLGISELVTNVIKHAYRNEHGRITIKALEYHDRLEFIIQDQGLPFKTRSVEGENLPALREGSFGLQITKMVMDEVVYTRTPDDQNIWRLVKRYSGAE